MRISKVLSNFNFSIGSLQRELIGYKPLIVFIRGKPVRVAFDGLFDSRTLIFQSAFFIKKMKEQNRKL